MSNYKETYRLLIDKFFSFYKEDNSENRLYFFKGFPQSFYEILNKKIQHFSKEWDSKYPDYKTLDGVNLLKDFITSSGTKWGFYEDLIAISMVLSDFSAYKGRIYVVKNNLFQNKNQMYEFYPIPIKVENNLLHSVFDEEDKISKDYKISSYYSDYKNIDDNIFLSFVNKHFSEDIKIYVDELNFFVSEDIPKSPTTFKNKQKSDLSELPIILNKLQCGNCCDTEFEIETDENAIKHDTAAINYFAHFFNVKFLFIEPKPHKNSDIDNYLYILKEFWGNDAQYRMSKFYSNPSLSTKTVEISQGTIINDIIIQCTNAVENDSSKYSDILVTAPTGAGKSIFFQIPGIYLHRLSKIQAVTIVVCPLVALMEDQVNELSEKGINFATFINSDITYEEKQQRIEGIKNGQYSIVYLSPELLLSTEIHSLIGERKIGLMVVDEAHLVTSWGRDFRVDYWFLGDYIEKIRHRFSKSKIKSLKFPVLCLTATAVYGGQDDSVFDLINSLHLECYTNHQYIGYVIRDNIEFIIRRPEITSKSISEEKLQLTVSAICKAINNHEKTIIYFPYVKQIKEVLANLLIEHKEKQKQVEHYFSGEMDYVEKKYSIP